MSMLAEPRRKQKWSLNPRGKHWSDDSNKFGQKMLEKMGWSSGKGLGANEQGMTEFVRVSVKNNTAGFGFSIDKQDQAWTEQQENFNDFLQQLQSKQDSTVASKSEKPADTSSGKSLEEMSKQSRVRVHYQKFTRGKDVNKYSTKDIANIFGQKNLDEKVDKQEINEGYIPDTIGSVDKTAGICTINSGSITDYLKKKDFGYVDTGERKINKDNSSESEAEQRLGFEFASSAAPKQKETKKSKDTNDYAFDNPCLITNGTTDAARPVSSSKSSKKRKKEFAFENGGLDLNDPIETAVPKVSKANSSSIENSTMGFVNDALNLDTVADESRNGKEFEVARTQFGLSNNALDLTDESTDKKRVTFNDHVEYSTDSSTKKKKTMLDKFEVESGKRKKKRKREECEDSSAPTGFVNTALDVDAVSEEVNDNEENERKVKKAKRKKKRMSNLETIEEAVDEDKETQSNAVVEIVTLDESFEKLNEEATNEDVSKKKKKKTKRKEKTAISVIDIMDEPEVNQLDNAVERVNTENGIGTEETFVCKGKKKKKKKDDRVKSPVINNTNEEQTIILNDSGQSVDDSDTKKKKKKHKKTSTKAVEIIKEDATLQEVTDSKEVSDKERTSLEVIEEVSEAKLPKREKKSEKSKDKSESQTNLPVNDQMQRKEEYNEVDAGNTQSPSRKHTREYANSASTNCSPWRRTAKMSKRVLIDLFHKNLIQNFPGSNIQDIKGYAIDIGYNAS